MKNWKEFDKTFDYTIREMIDALDTYQKDVQTVHTALTLAQEQNPGKGNQKRIQYLEDELLRITVDLKNYELRMTSIFSDVDELMNTMDEEFSFVEGETECL